MADFLQPAAGGWATGATPGPTNGPLLSLNDLATLAQAPQRAAAANVPTTASLPAGAGDWWNLPAKIAAGRQIAGEESDKFPTHNDGGDAMRHAEWSQRMATDIGPVFSTLVGVGHEGQNVFDSLRDSGARYAQERLDPSAAAKKAPPPSIGQTLQESAMDMHNNAAGIHAAMAGAPIDLTKLQISPRPALF